ncbi:LysE family translocator [Nonomuraea sediminis]|uniref:LysE family translocator n=1 Tax=Nonomuraea sediminis TaxID=2835864 RepID=UPI001BDD8AAE|nr:LysE family translocator [Nonomuraea sediminis]
MPSPSTLALFCAATLALLLVPGPAVLFIVTRSVAQGRAAGLISVLGVHAGSLVHVVAAALGISALLAASATAFTIVKYAGVAYLVYLGVRKLMRGKPIEEPLELEVKSNRRILSEGFVVNILNPKTAIFFMAFLPQFTNPAAGHVWAQMLVLGLIFTALGMVTDGSYAFMSSAVAGRFRHSTTARRRLDIGSGLVYLGLGAFLATSK